MRGFVYSDREGVDPVVVDRDFYYVVNRETMRLGCRLVAPAPPEPDDRMIIPLELV